MKVPKERTQKVEHERFALTKRLKWQEGGLSIVYQNKKMFVGEYLGEKGGSPLHPKDIDVLGLKLGTLRKKMEGANFNHH